MSERAIPTKRHFDSLQCLTNALHKKSFYLGSPGSSSPDESTCLGLCAWPRWLYIPLLLPPLEKGSRLRLKPGKFAFSDETRKPPYLNCPYLGGDALLDFRHLLSRCRELQGDEGGAVGTNDGEVDGQKSKSMA